MYFDQNAQKTEMMHLDQGAQVAKTIMKACIVVVLGCFCIGVALFMPDYLRRESTILKAEYDKYCLATGQSVEISQRLKKELPPQLEDLLAFRLMDCRTEIKRAAARYDEVMLTLRPENKSKFLAEGYPEKLGD